MTSRQIHASLAPRIAAKDAPEAFEAAYDETIFLDGEARVAGTAGSETTKTPGEEVPEPGMIGRNCFLIDPNERITE